MSIIIITMIKTQKKKKNLTIECLFKKKKIGDIIGLIISNIVKCKLLKVYIDGNRVNI